MALPRISEEQMKSIVIPAATAGTSGYVAYSMSEKAPEMVGILTAVGATYLITR